MRFSGARGVGSRRGLCSTMIARTTTKLQSSAVVVVAAAATVWNSKFALALSLRCAPLVSRASADAREREGAARGQIRISPSRSAKEEERERKSTYLCRDQRVKKSSVFFLALTFFPPLRPRLSFFFTFSYSCSVSYTYSFSLSNRARAFSLSLSPSPLKTRVVAAAQRARKLNTFIVVLLLSSSSVLSLFSLSLSPNVSGKKNSLLSPLPSPAPPVPHRGLLPVGKASRLHAAAPGVVPGELGRSGERRGEPCVVLDSLFLILSFFSTRA